VLEAEPAFLRSARDPRSMCSTPLTLPLRRTNAQPRLSRIWPETAEHQLAGLAGQQSVKAPVSGCGKNLLDLCNLCSRNKGLASPIRVRQKLYFWPHRPANACLTRSYRHLHNIGETGLGKSSRRPGCALSVSRGRFFAENEAFATGERFLCMQEPHPWPERAQAGPKCVRGRSASTRNLLSLACN
jgi:hypothetical protein